MEKSEISEKKCFGQDGIKWTEMHSEPLFFLYIEVHICTFFASDVPASPDASQTPHIWQELAKYWE